MPVFNCERYLEESIQSILSQTYTKFEFIIINDGSTDRSEQIIKSFQKQDERITLINQKNQGITNSLNTGIRISKGKYIARMDADDICHPDRFNMQLKWLQKNKDIDIVGSQVELIDENGNLIKPLNQLPIDDFLIKWELIFGTPLIHPSLMIRKSIFEKYGMYDENFSYAQDLAMWRKIAIYSKFANLPNRLMKIRQKLLISNGKEKAQNNVRINTLGEYLNKMCGEIPMEIYEPRNQDYFKSGKPIVNSVKGFIRLIIDIKKGFIKKNCESTQQVQIINNQVSKLFLRAVSFNYNQGMFPIQLLISSFIVFPKILFRKQFWIETVLLFYTPLKVVYNSK